MGSTYSYDDHEVEKVSTAAQSEDLKSEQSLFKKKPLVFSCARSEPRVVETLAEDLQYIGLDIFPVARIKHLLESICKKELEVTEDIVTEF